MTPRVSSVNLGISSEFAGILTNADIHADLTSMGDTVILSVIATRRGDKNGHTAGGCLRVVGT